MTLLPHRRRLPDRSPSFDDRVGNLLGGLEFAELAPLAHDPHPGRLITEIDLWEISLVTFPMLPGARVTGVKTASNRKG